MPQDLIRVGGRGINLAQVVRWFSRLGAATESDGAGGQKPTEETVEILHIEYVNGQSDTFTREEAVALRSALERQARDLMEPPGEGIY